MVLAKLTTKGQVTIPLAIRRALDVDTGDQIVFDIDKNGNVIVSKAEVVIIPKKVSKEFRAVEE